MYQLINAGKRKGDDRIPRPGGHHGGPGAGPGGGPHGGPGMGPGRGPGMPGMGPGRGPGMPGMGPGRGPGMPGVPMGRPPRPPRPPRPHGPGWGPGPYRRGGSLGCMGTFLLGAGGLTALLAALFSLIL